MSKLIEIKSYSNVNIFDTRRLICTNDDCISSFIISIILTKLKVVYINLMLYLCPMKIILEKQELLKQAAPEESELILHEIQKLTVLKSEVNALMGRIITK